MTHQPADKAQRLPNEDALDLDEPTSKLEGEPEHPGNSADVIIKSKAVRPPVAVEQLAEALEERQKPDQRQKVEEISFSDRRQVKRRATDLS